MTGVTVTPATGSVEVGKTIKLTAAVTPADATDQTGAWSVSDSTLGTIAEDGTLTGVKAGSVDVNWTSTDGAKVGSATIEITAAAEATE